VRLLLTGASGFFGGHFAPPAARRFELYSAYYSHPEKITAGRPLALDLTDAAALGRALADRRPEVVVHAAASNRDEQNQQAIVPGARALAEYTRAAGARLIHFSSDLVFGGAAAPYADDSPPDPVMPYGRRKAEAEALVAELDPRALIVRPSLIYGFGPIDAQTAWLAGALERGETVRLFTDEVRCPVWVHDLCEAVLELASADKARIAGPMNLGGPQPLTRWEFGLKMLKAVGVSPGSNVVPSTIAESGMLRPGNLTLRSERAAQLLATRLRTVDEAVAAATEA
jgi:dTDP-4-dehydrorhamnose reductase